MLGRGLKVKKKKAKSTKVRVITLKVVWVTSWMLLIAKFEEGEVEKMRARTGVTCTNMRIYFSLLYDCISWKCKFGKL